MILTELVRVLECDCKIGSFLSNTVPEYIQRLVLTTVQLGTVSYLGLQVDFHVNA